MTDLSTTEMADVMKAINKRYGYDFSDYAQPFLQRRMKRIMTKNRIADAEALQLRIKNDDWFFIHEIIEELTIRVTELFRDPDFFQSLHEHVISRLATYPVIRVWVAGCSTGEEAYSVAILLDSYGLYDRSVIYCTDINENALQRAKSGIYPTSVLENHDIPWVNGLNKGLHHYYTREENNIVFNEFLKKNMVFSFHNLVSDQSFNEFQLILCRNVLIYFNETLKNKVFKLLHESLCSFGFLGLGSKETVMFSEWQHQFQTLDSQNKIYKRK